MFTFVLNKQYNNPLTPIKKPRIKLKEGDKFGFWIVLGEGTSKTYKNNRKHRHIICQCTGCINKTIKEVDLGSLRAGLSTSCGCEKDRLAIKRNTVHGFRSHPIRNVHRNMIARCYNKSFKQYKDYGGRGIKICDEWKNNLGSFGKWALENGYKKGLQINRIDNDGDYEPSNCNFVTHKTNVNNSRRNIIVIYKNTKYSFIQFWEKFGKVSYGTAKHRYQNQGMSAIEAVTAPLKRKRR